MTQIRTFLLLAPLLAGLVCWLAVRSFLRGLEGEENAQVEGE